MTMEQLETHDILISTRLLIKTGSNFLIAAEVVKQLNIMNGRTVVKVIHITGGEGIPVQVRHIPAQGFTPLIQCRALELVIPIEGQFNNPTDQLIPVNFPVTTGIEPQDKLGTSQQRLGEAGIELALGGIKFALEHVFNRSADGSAVDIPRHVHQTVDEFFERVNPNKKPYQTSFTDLPDTDQRLVQLIGRGMKKLVPRMYLNQLGNCFEVVTARTKTGAIQHILNSLADQWNFEWADIINR